MLSDTQREEKSEGKRWLPSLGVNYDESRSRGLRLLRTCAEEEHMGSEGS